MKRFIGVFLAFLSGNCFSDTEFSKKSDQTTTMIESVNLKEQKPLLNGTTYGLSTDITVQNKRSELVAKL